MKATIKKNALQKALGDLTRSKEKDATVRLVATLDRLELQVVGTDVSVMRTVETEQISERGTLAVGLGVLSSAVATMRGETIELEDDNAHTSLFFQSGDQEQCIPLLGLDSMPPWPPAPNAEMVSLPSAAIRRGLAACKRFVSDDMTREILAKIRIAFDGATCKSDATDGYALSTSVEPCESASPVAVFVRRDVIGLVELFLTEDEIHIRTDGSRTVFDGPELRIQFSHGDMFAPVEQITNALRSGTTASVATKEMAAALKSLIVSPSQSGVVHGATFELAADHLKICSVSKNGESYSDAVTVADFSGKNPAKFAINPRILLSACLSCSSERATLDAGVNELDPVVLRGEYETFVIMPMRM